jgi:hypothetical protein
VIWNPNGPEPRPDLAELRAELADLMPFLDDEDGLTPDHAQDLRARVADLVARIGDDR